MTTPGKAIVIRNQRRQRWDNTHLSNVLCERNKEIASLKIHISELEYFRRKVAVAWEAHKDCGPECSLNDELEVILNP